MKKIFLPKGLPCAEALGAEEYVLTEWSKVDVKQRVLLLNLMPKKAETEEDICRVLSKCDASVQVVPIKIKGQTYKNTPQEHMDRFYLDFDEIEAHDFDRLIVTGAPLEQIPFEQVRYWPQLCRIMDWADQHVGRTLYICWAAQAALYHFYGVQKHGLPKKMFGIFEQIVRKDFEIVPMLKKIVPNFFLPQSRHTEVWAEEIEQHADEGLQILAQSEESGVGLVATADLRRVFVTGHAEYHAETLDSEYHRDLSRQLPIEKPLHYYDEEGKILYSWERDAVQLYKNFLEA